MSAHSSNSGIHHEGIIPDQMLDEALALGAALPIISSGWAQ
jgi:hypothetical protein